MTGTYDMTMMYAMHNALRRELEQVARITARPGDDPRRILAGAVGWEIFKKALHVHHGAEDEALWPVMAEILADRPDDLAVLDAMEAEHAQIDPLIAAVDAALADPEAGPGRVAAATDALAVSLLGHLRHEEADGLPLIDATVSPEQFVHFGRVHAAKTGPDGPRLTPWLLDGADERTTTTMLGMLPPPVLAAYRTEWKPAYDALDRWNTGTGTGTGTAARTGTAAGA